MFAERRSRWDDGSDQGPLIRCPSYVTEPEPVLVGWNLEPTSAIRFEQPALTL